MLLPLHAHPPPALHVQPPPVPQLVPQVPQLLGSVVRFVQPVLAQHVAPPAQAPEPLHVHVPAALQPLAVVPHVPHSCTVRVLPQLSAAVTAPHVRPRRAQNDESLSFRQPQTPGVKAPQFCSCAHAPQLGTVRC